LLASAGGNPQRKLFEINAYAGTAAVTLSLGGVLVYQAASALGGTSSNVMPLPRRWLPSAVLLVALFGAAVAWGQIEVNSPARVPWVFPLTNLVVVCVPSTLVAVTVTLRYLKFHPMAWPVSRREWTTGAIYGAVGATAIASVINTAYLVIVGSLLIHFKGQGSAFNLEDNLPSLPTHWGVLFDLSVLSVVAPLNEEFWKGMIVAFFFFRRGGPARCFLWGVLAGAGFNLLETFQNSLTVISPDVVSDRTIGDQWWLFAAARGGTAAIHATATGFSALGFYGLFRHKPRYMLGYPLGVMTHGAWNFLNYTLAGDAFFSKAGPDSALLDVISVAGLCVLFCACLVALWEMPRRLPDGGAPIYRLLGMLPRQAVTTSEPVAEPVNAAHGAAV
jgi:RsiW-degrading membrane proteinase PrsW (M82 family)